MSSPAEPSQGVILAAGQGSRLRPVTSHTPKALVPYFGHPLIDYSAAHLVRAGVSRVAVNAHYLGEQVEAYVHEHLARRFPDIEWYVSNEEVLLGTGGALDRLRPWFDDGDFWVVNADAVFACDLVSVAQSHAASGALGTWVVTSALEEPALRTVTLSDDNCLQGVLTTASPDAVAFCGIHIAGPGLLEQLPHGRSCVVRDGYLPWMASGARVHAFQTSAFWADTGTPERYLKAHMDGIGQVDLWREWGIFRPSVFR